MTDEEEAIRALRRHARGRVSLPAKLMVIMAALGIGIGLTLILLTSGASLGGAPPTGEGVAGWRFAWAIGPFALLWCGGIGYGAWEMDRLGNYRAAKVGAWMAVVPVPVPAYLLWAIGAVLGLVALNDPAVRAAFASGNEGAREAYFAAHPYRPSGRRRPKRPVDEPGGDR